MVNDTLQRIAPQKLRVQEADRIVAHGIEGQLGETVEPKGAYIKYREAYPMLLYALDRSDPLRTPLHEAGHHMWDYGFFDVYEKSTLLKAAEEQGWLDKFNVHERYPGLSKHNKSIEAIMDAYGRWESDRAFAVTPEVHGIFEKIKAFFDALKERVGQLLGKDPTWEDIFQKVSTGEVGSREGEAAGCAGV